MTAEVKFRTLALADPNLRVIFGFPLFRFFDRQETPGYVNRGTCARYRRVSTVRTYSMEGLQNLSQIRFQVDVLDFSAEAARAGRDAVIRWLGTVDFASSDQFGSPVVTPRQFPNFVLNERAGMEPRTEPPVYAESIDVRVFCLED